MIPGPVTTIPTRSPETLSSVTDVPAAAATVLISSAEVRFAAASISPAVLKSKRSWMFDFPAQAPRSTRACRQLPVESNSSCTDWLLDVPAADEAVTVLGSSAFTSSSADFGLLFVAITSHVRPLSTEMNTRALSRIVSLSRSPWAFWVSRK